MPETITEAAAVAEEVAAPAEIVGSVDLTTISQQLDTVITWQTVQASNQWVIMGLILGIVVAVIIGRTFK